MSTGQGGSDFTPPDPDEGEDVPVTTGGPAPPPATDGDWAARQAATEPSGHGAGSPADSGGDDGADENSDHGGADSGGDDTGDGGGADSGGDDTGDAGGDDGAAETGDDGGDDGGDETGDSGGDDDGEPAGIAGDLDDPPVAGTRGRRSSGPEPKAAPTGGLGPGVEDERFGHPVRHYRMGVSGAALALAWARQEDAPDGATVVVEREVSPLGRLGRMWTVAPESTLSCAIVLRPPLSVEQADATWLLAAVAAAEGAEEVSGRRLATWWPDRVVDAETDEEVAALKVEIQLGPGKVRSAVATIRVDLGRLGIEPERRDALLEAVLGALDRNSVGLGEGSEGVAAAYDGRCGLLGRRVKLRLLPKGETRGLARRVDRSARLELESATGMVQKIAIDNLRDLEAV